MQRIVQSTQVIFDMQEGPLTVSRRAFAPKRDVMSRVALYAFTVQTVANKNEKKEKRARK